MASSKRSKRSQTLLAETAPLSLPQLLELAIANSNGTTVVNYYELRRLLGGILWLLEGILRLLDLWELPGQQQGLSPTQLEGAQPAEASPGLEEAAGGTQAWPQGQISKGQEVQEHLLQKTTSSPRVPSAAADVKEMEEGDVSGVSKAVALYRNLLEEMSGVTVAQACMAEDLRTIQKALGLLGDEVELVGKDGRIYKGRRPLLVDKEGTATSPEQKPASAYSQLGQAAPGIFIQPLHHKYSSVPAERNLGSLGKPTPSSRRASSCRQQD
ncbi:uncharacterized protein LOC121085730 [Falco naumanni]|uniref:uncharacterized protein LOC121085730 n=1 Tax=Falco naumanni TaxID=148594 RepID=UPI001ADE808A|nr:uncharacterized protein LOC121085730 [Falco naumanni]